MSKLPRLERATADRPNSSSERIDDSMLAEALARYTELQESGLSFSRSEFLALYPGIETELHECLDQLDLLSQLATNMSEDAAEQLHEDVSLGTGQHILGDYKLLRQVGRGGMGIVYEARQLSIDRRVALKVLPAAAVLDPQALARFRNEVQAAALLEHPHIVNVLGMGCERGIHYYTMRFINGLTLAQILKSVREQCMSDDFASPATPAALARTLHDSAGRRVAQPDDRAIKEQPVESTGRSGRLKADFFRVIAQLGIQAAEALFYAHQQGVLHRDIKPSNLLLDESGSLWVTDFGLARIESTASLTMTGDLVGTLRYMSPEQAQAESACVDQRSDIYSLGATLYEMVTLRPLVVGDVREDILSQVARAAPVPPRRLQPNVPRDLETILLKAVAKDPNDRYSNCYDFAQDLQRFFDRRPIVARRPGALVRALRWTQRNAQLATLSLAFVCLSLLGTAVAVWRVNAAGRIALHERAQREIQESLARAAEQHLALHNAVSTTIIASQAWKTHDFGLFSQAVEAGTKPSQKVGFERSLLRQIAASLPRVFAQHAGPAYCLRLSPDERLLASAGADGVRITECSNGRLVHHLTDHGSDVNGLAWSDDGEMLATVGDDGRLWLYRTDTWEVIGALRADGAFVSVAFSSSLDLLVACERQSPRNGDRPENALHVWSVADLSQHDTFSGPTHLIEGLALSSDGHLVAVACRDAHVYIWNLEEKKLLHRLKLCAEEEPQPEVSAVAFAHRSQLLVVAARDGSVRLFDGSTGQLVQVLEPLIHAAEAVAFSPNDQLLTVGARDGVTYGYEPTTAGRWLQALEFKHAQSVWSQDIGRDGTIFVSGQRGLVECLDSYLPMERRRIKILSEPHRRKLAQVAQPPSRAANSAAVRWYERAAMMLRDRDDRDDERINASTKVTAFAYTPDGRSIALGCDGSTIQLCDRDTFLPMRLASWDGPACRNMAYSSDGQSLVIVTHSPLLKAFDGQSLRPLMEQSLQPGMSPNSLAFYPGDEHLIVAYGPHPNLAPQQTALAIESRSLLRSSAHLPRPFKGAAAHPVYTPESLTFLLRSAHDPVLDQLRKAISDGQTTWTAYSPEKHVFVCVFRDNTIRIFRDEQWDQPLVIHGGTALCSSLDISPDGELIAVSAAADGSDGTVRLFHTSTGRELFSLRHYLLKLYALRFSTDGRQLIAAGEGISGEGEITSWGELPATSLK